MVKKIYQVGGCVRDKILGIKNSDIDYVAVGYKIEDFAHLKMVGKDFPVFLNELGQEIALARVERKIAKGYNGFSVDTSNVTLKEDLKRRDLTINSIAYDEKDNTYIDPFNGIADIRNKVLRHTSKAFVEDPLRVLRLARFKVKFPEFSIAKETKELVASMREDLRHLQPDRVYKEIKKVFAMQQSWLFFETLLELGVLDVLFPTIYNLTKCSENSVYHQEENVFVHTMMVLKELKNESELLKFTALYHDIAKPIMYQKTGGANAGGHDNIEVVKPLIDSYLPAKLKKRVLFLIKNHIRISLLDKMRVNKIASFFESYKKDRELFNAQLIFAKADTLGRIGIDKKILNNQKLLTIFDKIANYSPSNWIKEQKKPPKGETIKQHIHKMNIKIISDVMQTA